ncbi:hypothetical protein COL26b_010404 [Colletotrichum chrysophilum]|uniref:uncharacterized protein n=1 Tax=Colletotrichum chrysophilum TaxID=1836956 RepID=UPI00230138EB|nr:uncharacterized protein COL26b_010404 [Colletotrichum chrysophilum]KAJ0350471.1 hypothetical protein KNSL1_003872 [Colletotrichum chrysophilum]KAJ0369416.1 hypothetical protein COL26b_010404 [Colletotrichum chrysophilum]
MQFSTIFAIASALTLVAAAPTPAPESSPAAATPAQLFKRKECPSNYASKGVCNGTSCMWGLVNYDCGVGSCVSLHGFARTAGNFDMEIGLLTFG